MDELFYGHPDVVKTENPLINLAYIYISPGTTRVVFQGILFERQLALEICIIGLSNQKC